MRSVVRQNLEQIRHNFVPCASVWSCIPALTVRCSLVCSDVSSSSAMRRFDGLSNFCSDFWNLRRREVIVGRHIALNGRRSRALKTWTFGLIQGRDEVSRLKQRGSLEREGPASTQLNQD
jgi:hypothetical protein